MKDLIRRLKMIESNCNIPKNQRDIITEAINVIKTGSRTAKWVTKDGSSHICSNCGEEMCGDHDHIIETFLYCMNCGSKMEE